ncbi:TPA: hypothetical protein DCE37_25145 [Candidatus Latescibacteria bacterium]|nr:hypothetical protein [Candidatus Latescibacterota bacterium]
MTRILNPAVVAVLALVTLDRMTGSPSAGVLLLAVVLGPGVPTSWAIVLRLTGRSPSVFLPDGGQRVLPLIFAVVSNGFAVWILPGMGASDAVVALMATYGIVSLVAALISPRWMLSLHVAGIVMPVAIGLRTFGTGTSWFLPLIPLVGWSRLRCGEHTVGQVIVGALTGLVAAAGAISLTLTD